MNYVRPLYYHWPVTLGKDRLRSLGIILLTIAVFLAGLFIVAQLERRAEGASPAEERGGGEAADGGIRTSEGGDARAIRMVDTPTEIEDGGDDPAVDRDESTRLVPITGPAAGAVERWAMDLNGTVSHFARSAPDDSAVLILLLDGETLAGTGPIDEEAVRIAQGNESTEESGAATPITDTVPSFVMDAVVAEIASRGSAEAVYRIVDGDSPDRERAAVREYILLFSTEASLILRFYVEEGEILDIEISPVE